MLKRLKVPLLFRALSPSLAAFLALFAILAIFAFYATPFASHVEAYLFDARSRLKPRTKAVPELVLLTINEDTISRLGGSATRQVPVAKLYELLKRLKNQQPAKVALLFLPNVFNFSDPMVERLVNLVAQDDRFLLGTLGYHGESPSGVDLPDALSPATAHIFGIDTLKKRSNSLVRALPIHGYLGLLLRPLLPAVLAGKNPNPATESRLLDLPDVNGEGWYALNLLSSRSFQKIDAADFLADDKAYSGQINGKRILIGQVAFREWMTQTREQMVANTPIKGDPDTYRGGEAILYLTANATENLLTDSWLKTSPTFVTCLQTALVTAVFGGVWALGVVPAVLIITFGWLFLLLCHGLLFHFTATFVPLADTAIFSSLAVLIGAVARLNIDAASGAKIRAETATKSALALSQSRYLDRFSRAMAAANFGIKSRLENALATNPSHPTDRDLLERALSTSADFAEYLEGIMQAQAAESAKPGRVRLQRVKLHPLIETVVQRFEHKLHEHEIDLKISCPVELTVRTNAQLLDNIIFNLLSNAIRYSPDGGQVELSAKAEGRGAVIVVQDQGPGIDPEFREKIFEKFYRVKTDDVYRIKGTGLGLYLCRYFAARIGATVTYAPSSEPGARFVVRVGGRS